MQPAHNDGDRPATGGAALGDGLLLMSNLFAMFDRADFGVLLIDPFANRTLTANARAADLLGRDRRTLSATATSDLFLSAMPKLLILTEACLQGPGAWREELEVETPTQGTAHLHCHASVVSLADDRRLILLALFDARSQRRRRANAPRSIAESRRASFKRTVSSANWSAAANSFSTPSARAFTA